MVSSLGQLNFGKSFNRCASWSTGKARQFGARWAKCGLQIACGTLWNFCNFPKASLRGCPLAHCSCVFLKLMFAQWGLWNCRSCFRDPQGILTPTPKIKPEVAVCTFTVLFWGGDFLHFLELFHPFSCLCSTWKIYMQQFDLSPVKIAYPYFRETLGMSWWDLQFDFYLLLTWHHFKLMLLDSAD